MHEIPLIVSTAWLAERMEDPKLRILDATVFMQFPEAGGPPEVKSGKESFQESHLPGAVYADIVGELSDTDANFPFTVPSRELFVEKMTNLGVGDDTYTVIYDQNALVGKEIASSYWASRLSWQLRYEGFTNIAVLEGGLQKWIAESRELTADAEAYPKAEFTGERRPEMLATKDDVREALEDDSIVIINSLSPQDFENAHIPNSHNVFFGAHADEQTKALHSDEQLRTAFESVGALDPSKKVITYCGGGIAATWNALLLNKLGQHNVAIYDGSMNEWTSDPTCPVIRK